MKAKFLTTWIFFILLAAAWVYPEHSFSQIAFSSNRDGNYEIYVMNPDGTNQTRLTNNIADDVLPTWSPDGSKIYFASNRDGTYEIYVMNANGTNQTRLTDNSASDTEPSVSPDGTKIAFRTNRDGNDEVYVMNADGTNPVNLTNLICFGWNGICPEGEPRWSPDGTKIVFATWRGGTADIWVMNSDGTNPVQLTFGLWASNPAWSPDGTRIAFSHQGNIVVLNADGTNQTRIVSVGCCISPYVGSWSPDGTRIVIFSELFDGNFEIYTINNDGTNRVRLTNNIANDLWPSWSPSIIVPFAAFDAKVEITMGPLANDDAFEVKATFALGAGSNGIDIPTEIVSLSLSGGTGTFSITIPAGAFTQDNKGRFKFEGVIDGVALETMIQPLLGGSFEFKAEGTGADLTGITNPVEVGLTIRDDGGSTTVEAEFGSK